MKEEYGKDKHDWFPNETTKKLKTHNKRTPGLFKVEFQGNSIYALCSKLYFVEGENKNKYSCKGMGARGCFININDMYKNYVDKGGVRVYEAYEVK